MLAFYRRLFLLLYLATILFTVAIELAFVSTGDLTWSSFFLGLGGYTVAIAAIVLISYVMVLKAIARSERDKEELEESEEQYRDLFENATDLIQSVSPDGRFQYVNRAWRQALGYSEEEVREITLFDVIHPDSMEHCMETFKRVMSGEVVIGVEAVFVSKDGRRVLVEGNVNCRFDSGQPVATRGIFRDVTERKHDEDEIKRVNAELDGFAHTVSHDLQGPLTAMRLANDLLSQLMEEPQTESVREDMRQTVQIVGRNITASSRLIKDLLALARAGQVPDSVSSVDVSEVVARVIDENVGSIKGGGIDVVVGDDLGRITANPTHVYQVFSNLIGNAIRHNDSPNPRVTVTLLGAEGGNRRYLVKDNGSGMPPGDIDRIFTPFFKGKSGETGIGLATVKKIVRTNGWEIRAYSDNGACFELVVNPSPS